ncbi:unnamed protein product [Microthlaspi erraticum]|uniref:Uncharacterized protein n=1 Tax=Microthlaspi erraticum TaxID=1685480 RepID=A0A6D2K416_9BRAS|nr:unnamed protein product [Microthlaspi erraticum]
MKWYYKGWCLDTSVPPKELGGKVVVWRETAIRSTPSGTSAPLLLLPQSVWLPWPWWSWCSRVWVPSLGSPGKVGSYSNPGFSNAPSGQLDLSSIELSFLCLDSIESGGRVERLALELFLLLCVLSPSSLGSKEEAL